MQTSTQIIGRWTHYRTDGSVATGIYQTTYVNDWPIQIGTTIALTGPTPQAHAGEHKGAPYDSDHVYRDTDESRQESRDRGTPWVV